MGLKHVLRRLARAPLFSALTILTLAIGIGANSAIFAVIDGVLLSPLPYADAERLVDVNHRAPGVNIERAGAAPFLYFTYRDHSRTFQDVGLWRQDTVSVTGVGEPEEIPALDVTDGVLPVLGVVPHVGRLFTKDDDTPNSPDTAILTYGYWRARFGGDPVVIGRRVTMDGKPREVIGVLPQAFRFLDSRVSVILPLKIDRSKTFLGGFGFSAAARLKPGVTLAEVNAD